MRALAGGVAAAIEAVLAIYFGFYTLFLAISTAFAGVYRLRSRGRRSRGTPPAVHRIAVLLPAYRAGTGFLRVVDAARAQSYPAELVDVHVLAQRCAEEVVAGVRERGAIVRERAFDDGTPGNPYLRALRWFVPEVIADGHRAGRPYDIFVLVDKDNILAPDFLEKIVAPFHRGAEIAQGVRLPLEIDTDAAALDYVAEAMNDQTLRAARAAMGLSAEISGSGVAIRPEIWARALETVDLASPVMDKTTLLELLKLGAKVAYCPDARLYEEKTGSFTAIGSQRTRWVGGQIYLARKHGLRAILRGLRTGNLDLVDYGLVMGRPPRAIHVAAFPLLIALAALRPVGWLPGPIGWVVLAILYGACIVLTLAFAGAPGRVYRALVLGGPRFAAGILRAAVKGSSRKIQGTFIHTEHADRAPGSGKPAGSVRR